MNKFYKYFFYLEIIIIIFFYFKGKKIELDKKKSIEKRKSYDLNNNEYLNKLFNNEKLLNISKKRQNNIDKVLNEIKNINSNSIYSKIYILNNLISKELCLWIIYESEKYSKEIHWSRERHKEYPTIDNNINNIKSINNYLYNITYLNIIPFIEKKYNLNINSLGIHEIFIVKYNLNGQIKLEEHVDGCQFSFIIPLNNDFTGGGTKFKYIETKIITDPGNVIIFCGKHKHKGIEIKSGERYIIAGFLNYK
tara:strand:- start:168 stop:920 length:753 start_codon:yes stop_codon:yes gene_type:complete